MVDDDLIVESAPLSPSAPRVLIVDDEETVVLTLGGVLELDHYEITTTTSLPEALDLLSSQHFDVVLTDLRMDGMDGSDVLSALADSNAKGTAAIVLTGYGSLDSAVRVMR